MDSSSRLYDDEIEHYLNATPQPSIFPYLYSTTTPKLVRASTSSDNVDHEPTNHLKVTVDFEDDLNKMCEDWTKDEIMEGRRLVHFSAIQQLSHLSLDFRPIEQRDYVPDSAVISCIYWEKEDEYYVTSVDLIILLEHLVRSKFPIEEKNRIRRNMESIGPLTISKGHPKYGDLYTQIMKYENPKPRHIEKRVKVIHWNNLQKALVKVLGKYTIVPFHQQEFVNPTQHSSIMSLMYSVSNPNSTPDLSQFTEHTHTGQILSDHQHEQQQQHHQQQQQHHPQQHQQSPHTPPQPQPPSQPPSQPPYPPHHPL